MCSLVRDKLTGATDLRYLDIKMLRKDAIIIQADNFLINRFLSE